MAVSDKQCTQKCIYIYLLNPIPETLCWCDPHTIETQTPAIVERKMSQSAHRENDELECTVFCNLCLHFQPCIPIADEAFKTWYTMTTTCTHWSMKLIEKLTIGMASFTRTTASCLIQPFNAAIAVSLQRCSLSPICHLPGVVLLCSSCGTEELFSSATVPEDDTGAILLWQARPPTKMPDATLVQWIATWNWNQ